MPYTWEAYFFYEEIYGMADFCIDGSIDDSLFKYTEERYKRSGTDNNSCKENETQTEAAKQRVKRKEERKKKIKENFKKEITKEERQQKDQKQHR